MMHERRRQAAGHVEIALRTTARLGAWPWHAQTQATYASLLATGTTKQRKGARLLATSAMGAAVRFGMDNLRAEAERLTRKLGARRRRSGG
jgi:hypothetical protein